MIPTSMKIGVKLILAFRNLRSRKGLVQLRLDVENRAVLLSPCGSGKQNADKQYYRFWINLSLNFKTFYYANHSHNRK